MNAACIALVQPIKGVHAYSMHTTLCIMHDTVMDHAMGTACVCTGHRGDAYNLAHTYMHTCHGRCMCVYRSSRGCIQPCTYIHAYMSWALHVCVQVIEGMREDGVRVSQAAVLDMDVGHLNHGSRLDLPYGIAGWGIKPHANERFQVLS